MEKEIVERLHKRFKENVSFYDKINEYYLGDTDVSKSYQETDRSNLKISTNYLKKFVKEEAAYSVGNPITYASKTDNENVRSELDIVFENYNENHDINLFQTMVLFGVAYEVEFIDKWDDMQVKIVKPTEGIHEEDEEGNTSAFIRVFKKFNGDVVENYIDLYTESEIINYNIDEGKYEEIGRTFHYFAEVPVAVAKLSEYTWKDTLFKDIKGLQDALETNLSDITNEISDFRNAYLVMTGIDIDDEDAKDMKRLGIIHNPTAEGKVEWLIKNINDTFIQNTIKTLVEKMYELTSHINHNDVEQSSNASGVALKSKLISLMQRCTVNQNSYKELLKTRVRIVFTYLKQKKNVSLDWKDVKLTFTPCIPNDDLQIAQIIQMLDGKVSAETGLNLLSFIEDGKSEYEKAQQEITDNGTMDSYNDVTIDEENDNVDVIAGAGGEEV